MARPVPFPPVVIWLLAAAVVVGALTWLRTDAADDALRDAAAERAVETQTQIDETEKRFYDALDRPAGCGWHDRLQSICASP